VRDDVKKGMVVIFLKIDSWNQSIQVARMKVDMLEPGK